MIDVCQVTNYKSAFFIRKNWENLAEEMPVTNSGKLMELHDAEMFLSKTCCWKVA